MVNLMAGHFGGTLHAPRLHLGRLLAPAACTVRHPSLSQPTPSPTRQAFLNEGRAYLYQFSPLSGLAASQIADGQTSMGP